MQQFQMIKLNRKVVNNKSRPGIVNNNGGKISSISHCLNMSTYLKLMNTNNINNIRLDFGQCRRKSQLSSQPLIRVLISHTYPGLLYYISWNINYAFYQEFSCRGKNQPETAAHKQVCVNVMLEVPTVAQSLGITATAGSQITCSSENIISVQRGSFRA